jgi:hypothetical protein
MISKNKVGTLVLIATNKTLVYRFLFQIAFQVSQVGLCPIFMQLIFTKLLILNEKLKKIQNLNFS